MLIFELWLSGSRYGEWTTGSKRLPYEVMYGRKLCPVTATVAGKGFKEP